ncbi:MAG: hypothetical protein Q4F45_01270 [Alistipes sp.]|nr:hypothetical protein [Alistipes sp.]
MKRLFCFLVATFAVAGSAVYAQEVDSTVPMQTLTSEEDVTIEESVDYVPAISLDARFGYDGIVSGKAAGFGGDGLFLNIDGKISKHFSYSLCHRLFESAGEDSSVFDATDILTLSYEVGNWAFTAGKDYVILGNWEYDAYDLDAYFDMNTMFYNNFDGRRWGVTAAWTNKSETSTFLLQVANSPYSEEPKVSSLYSYALGWQGAWDWYESYWTVNMWEYSHGCFVKNIALGNIFYVGDFSLTADFMMRAVELDELTDNLSLTLQPAYEVCDKVRVFGKFGWEKDSGNMFHADGLSLDDLRQENEENEALMPVYILPDKDYLFYGAGVEYFPIKDNKNVRLHAVWASNNYTKRHGINIGLTWKFDVVNAISRICKK